MRHFFEAVDAGQYDWRFFLFLLTILVATWVRDRIRTARAMNAFFEAQHCAQQTFEQKDADPADIQRCVFQALGYWQQWQRRPIPDTPTNGIASPVEWHAISLMQALPKEPLRYVM